MTVVPSCGTPGAEFELANAYRKDGKPRRRNDHPIRCVWCGRSLAKGEAVIKRAQDGWLVASCAEPLR